MDSAVAWATPRRIALLCALAAAAALATAAPGRADATAGTALRAKADGLMQEGRNREAVPVLDDLIRAAPDDGTAFETRGLAHWRALTGRIDDRDDGFATIQARMCLETEPTCPAVEAALADLGRAVALLSGPSRARALAERARIHLRLGHDALALSDEDDALRLAPEDVRVREDRAVLREHMGDADGALADLDAVLRLRPADGEDLVMRADLRRRKGDLAGARADLDEALAHAPPGPEPAWLEEARSLRRAVALPGEAGMQAETADLRVEKAEPGVDASGAVTMTVTFDAASRQRLAAYTAAHVGSPVQILVDGKVILEPRILSPITGGIIVISGNQSRADLERIARQLGMPGATVVLREAH